MTHFAPLPADDTDHEPDCDCGDCSELRAETLPSLKDRRSSCAVCGGVIGWIECPTGGWWAHKHHPADNHDAVADHSHTAHVERDSATGSYYLWCENDGCETVFQRYTVAMEAEDAAVNHERAEASPSPKADRPRDLPEPEDRPRDMIQRCDCGCGQAVLRGVNNVVILDDSSFRFASQACFVNWARRTFTEATS